MSELFKVASRRMIICFSTSLILMILFTQSVFPQAETATVGIVKVEPRYLLPESAVQIKAYLYDEDNNVVTIQAEIEAPDETVIATITLYDDGNHGDGNAGDNIFGNEWTSPADERDYFVDIIVPNGETKNNAGYFTCTLSKPKFNVYFGDLHTHTSYSDGEGTPYDAFLYTRDVALNDFQAVTDHHDQIENGEFIDLNNQAAAFTQDGIFVAIAGQEWSGTGSYQGSYNHINVFEADHVFVSAMDNLTAFYDELVKSGCIGHFNHPFRNLDFNSFAFSEVADLGIEAMEIRTDVQFQLFLGALNKGFRLGAVSSSDLHNSMWGNYIFWTGLLAPSLTKQNVLEAIKYHRTYSTYDKNFELYFKAENYWMGESFDNIDNINFEIIINDLDQGDNTSEIELLQDGEVIGRVFLDNDFYHWTSSITPSGGKHHYIVRVIQKDGDRIWSSPIWVNSVTDLPSTPIIDSPTNNITVVTFTPTFSWQSSGNADSYTLQLSTSSDFPETQSTVTVSGILGTSYTWLSDLLDNQSYYWRVSAFNNAGTSSYSAISRFTVNSGAVFVFESEIKITDNIYEDIEPSVIKVSGNQIWVAWSSNRDGNYEIYYKIGTNNGEAWSEDLKLTDNPSKDRTPSLLEDQDGNIWIIWQSNREGNREIFCKFFDGNTWSDDFNLSPEGNYEYGPSLALTQDGKIWALWSSNRTGGGDWEIYYRTYDGNNWSPPQCLTDSDEGYNNSPRLLQLNDGSIWFLWVWTDGTGNDEIMYKTCSGSIWSGETRLTYTPSIYEINPSILQDANGNIWLAYAKWSGGTFYRICQNGNWSDEVSLPSGNYYNQWSSITQTSDGRIWIAYQSKRNEINNIFLQRSLVPNPTSVEDYIELKLPANFVLYTNYPNPFNPETTIKYSIHEPANVRLAIYNLQGEEIKIIVDEGKSAGQYKVIWDGTNSFGSKVASGVYIYRIDALSREKHFIDAKKMLFLK